MAGSGGGYSIFDWLTGRAVLPAVVDAAGRAVGQGGIVEPAPVQRGPEWDDKVFWYHSPLTAPSTITREQIIEGEKKVPGNSWIRSNRSGTVEEQRKKRQEEQKKKEREALSKPSRDALRNPPEPRSYNDQTWEANIEDQERHGDSKDRHGKIVPKYDRYHKKDIPTWEGRDPFQPPPGVQRSPDPNRDPFKGGNSTGFSGGGFGMGMGGPQQQMMGIDPGALMSLYYAMLGGQMMQQMRQPMMGNPMMGPMAMIPQQQMQQPSLGWYNVPFQAPPQVMFGGGGTGTEGASGGSGGGQPQPQDRMADWQPYEYLDKGVDPNNAADFGRLEEPMTFRQDPFGWLTGRTITPREVRDIYYRQTQELKPGPNTPTGDDYELARTRAEESLRQKRDFIDDAHEKFPYPPTREELKAGMDKVKKYQQKKKGK